MMLMRYSDVIRFRYGNFFYATWSVVRWLTLYVPARYDMAEAYSAS